MTENLNKIFEGLDPEQVKAVSHLSGPTLIVAGAGSGKTRVLTHRIANIISQGTPAGRVLALTFTRKAAKEMKDRVAALVGWRCARALVMGTFHSVFIRFLRDYASSLGYPEGFTVYDTSDSLSLIKVCIKELNLDEKVYKPKSVLSRISEAKNSLCSPASYMAKANVVERDSRAKMPLLYRIYDLYWKKCRQAAVMDFDDILFEMNILLKDNPVALEEISGRFDYILVDEYQDTNRSQYYILKKLAAGHRNICVVGDDSQSIYAFRGAIIDNIIDFSKEYPETASFRLECNYRSTGTIVEAANSLIEHNERRIRKNCFSRADGGELIRLIRGYTEQEEASLVVSSLLDNLRRNSAQYGDFAILYRTNAQSRALEEALRRRNVPYMIYSGNSFYERQEIRDMMAYFKLACNTSDNESFRRVVNKPARGIGDTSLAALQAAAVAKGMNLLQAACEPDFASFGLKPAAAVKIAAFAGMIVSLNARTASEDAYSLASAIAVESGLMAFYGSDVSVEGQARLANLDELLNSVKAYVEQRQDEAYEDALVAGEDVDAVLASTLVTLPDYLENVALLSAVDTDAGEDPSNKVNLMTVHSAKGLEFPYVYVTGMEENLFPSGSSLSQPSEIEEERRLFYVALTRAGKTVHLSFADNRMRNGRTESNDVSRFIYELDARCLANPLPAHNSPMSPLLGRRTAAFPSVRQSHSGSRSFLEHGYERSASFVQRSSTSGVPVSSKSPVRIPDENFVPSPIAELREGQRVEHNRFGTGILKFLQRDNSGGKVVVDFDEYGEKTLLLKYAKIRIL